jgi:hypothetical protein
MRTFVILLALIFQAEAPPKKTSPEEYLKKRAELLRQVGDLKAKLAALEIELASRRLPPDPLGAIARIRPSPRAPVAPALPRTASVAPALPNRARNTAGSTRLRTDLLLLLVLIPQGRR